MTESLQAHELSPVGGSWTGLLFENPAVGYPLKLTWTFTVDFNEVRRGFGSVSPSLTIDWVPLPESSWLAMQGHHVACGSFSEPIETSVYYFDHHRYDSVELTITDQQAGTVDIRTNIAGDIDGLGIPELSTEATLSFGGICVQLDEVGTDVETARSRLAEFANTAGLRGRARGHNVVFEVV